ncbi:MAG: hypothetical protein C3F02_04405 [Parcubacteria group bacterium]|nr:MAG: hypothetical protein C3F02_04405 [Parcubacteria group bacterium]
MGKNQKIEKLNTEDYILYILNRLEPQKSDKIRLNKIAFFVEFAYIFYNNKVLSEANYAAIDKGPVIDGYDTILKSMANEGKIKIDGYVLRPLKSSEVNLTENDVVFINGIIDKYSAFNKDELIALSHATDSYKITTNNEKDMGGIINKKLAFLETFFQESEGEDDDKDEDTLPELDRKKLVEYEF